MTDIEAGKHKRILDAGLKHPVDQEKEVKTLANTGPNTAVSQAKSSLQVPLDTAKKKMSFSHCAFPLFYERAEVLADRT